MQPGQKKPPKPTVRTDSVRGVRPKEEPHPDRKVQAGQRHLEMGLGRLELPTSRF